MDAFIIYLKFSVVSWIFPILKIILQLLCIFFQGDSIQDFLDGYPSLFHKIIKFSKNQNTILLH